MKHLMRSLLFVPANNAKYFDKAVSSEADALVLDLEDAVPLSEKAFARQNIASYLATGKFAGRNVYIRVNASDCPDIIKDIRVGMHDDIDGFLLPKVADVLDIQFAGRLLSFAEKEFEFPQGRFSLLPLVETASAITNLKRIVKASDRIPAVCFGGYDLRSDLKIMDDTATSFQTVPKALLVIAAREAGIEPIDTPFFSLDDPAGLQAEKENAFSCGFTGSLVIHPRHISIVNACFTPNAQTVSNAKKILNAIREDAGCMVVDGKLVDGPVTILAQKVVDMMDLIEDTRYTERS